MKKIFNIIVIIALTLTLTGCGNKITEVTCTTNEETYTQKFTFTFKENKVIKYFSENSKIYESESHAKTAAETAQNSLEEEKQINGITYEYTANGNKLDVKVTVILEDITDKEVIKDTYLNQKLNTLIKGFKEYGYTCTTK